MGRGGGDSNPVMAQEDFVQRSCGHRLRFCNSPPHIEPALLSTAQACLWCICNK
jgi:hypothetical protein